MKKLSSLLKSVTFFAASLILFLSLISYTPADISFLSAPRPVSIHNLIGIVGAYIGFAFFSLFGFASYFLPLYLLFLGLVQLGKIEYSGLGKGRIVTFVSFLLFFIFLSTFIGLFFNEQTSAFHYAGFIGSNCAAFFRKYLGMYGSVITLSLLLIVNAILIFGLFFMDIVGLLGECIKNSIMWAKDLAQRPRKKEIPVAKLNKEAGRKQEYAKEIKPEVKPIAKPVIKPEIRVYTPQLTPVAADDEVVAPKISINREKPTTPAPAAGLSAQNKKLDEEAAKKKMEALEQQAGKSYDPKTFKLPTAQMLKIPPAPDLREVKEDIEANIKNLEETLSEFGVEAKVTSVQKGPVVTMYELQPAPGVKIMKISVLADDIALAMKSSSVRVVAPIPGRGTVGVEVPNEKKHLVFLREVLEDKAFTGAASKLTMAIGKDVSGNPVVADLKDMPHLLIAGATGAGKTVCVNSIISSIIVKAKPDEVKFILIDPKMVELTTYSGIPHLIHPVIVEAKKAFIALGWAVEEMERRYKMLAEEGVRNIDTFNAKGTKNMPYIVIVVDELADLMLLARESVETSIQRLAQLSRAVGIHLILATQRPSVDVITGVIKANFPARISFKVSSKVDSRTVLDMMGADKLLGKGDLLFLKPGAPKLIRTQGCFIDDEDMERLTDHLRAQGGPVYEQGIVEGEKKAAMNIGEDELFDEAVKTVMQARQASASIIQRRLRVGYTRAARLLDIMEQRGIVGPFCGSKAREILVDPQTFQNEEKIIQ